MEDIDVRTPFSIDRYTGEIHLNPNKNVKYYPIKISKINSKPTILDRIKSLFKKNDEYKKNVDDYLK